jgi:hypothetical protein
MGVNCPMVHQDIKFVGNSNNGFCLNQGFNLRWNKPNFPFDNYQQGSNGQSFNGNEPSLRDIVKYQLKINEDFGKRIHATNKLLENMRSKVDSFTVSMHNQLSFNKMLFTKIQQISAILPCPNSRDSTNTPIQESVKSISTLFQGKASDSTAKSPREVDKEKSRVMSKVSIKAILSQLWSSLREAKVPTIQCILGPFNVHYALYDWGASMNIMPKTVYDCLDEDPLISVSWCLELTDSTKVQPFGMVKDVLIEVRDSSILVDFIIIDMDPRQKTSMILGKPFLKLGNASINKKREIIKIKVNRQHKRFIF